ncbi:MAG: DUF2911 domain-containing protein [Saprospiraceae bacterium]|nr:DUF2911 domain-containing protein [Saprospiraceae bacterium]
MKRILIALLPALFFCATMDAQINTPAPSPTGEVKQTVGLTEFTINYSRPGVKDRTIFAADGLVPLGQIWRTGANAATTIEFDKDIMFGGKEVAAGKYALYTIPNTGSWTVMLYSDLSLGGNVGNYDESKEVVRTTVTPVEMPMSVETFTISIGSIRDDSAELGLIWDNMYVPVPIGVHTKKQVMAQLDNFAANPLAQVAGNYLNGGWYLHTSGTDSKKGLEYMSEGLKHSNSPFNFFWMQRKAEIQASLGDYAGAVKTAKMAHEAGAKAEGNAKGFYDNTVKAQLDANIKKWSSKS